MTATDHPAVTAALVYEATIAVRHLDAGRATLAALGDEIDKADAAACRLGTGHPEVYRAVVAFRVAREHVDSAWRSLGYAADNINERARP